MVKESWSVFILWWYFVLGLIWAEMCFTKFCKTAFLAYDALISESYKTKFDEIFTVWSHHIEDHMWVLSRSEMLIFLVKTKPQKQAEKYKF